MKTPDVIYVEFSEDVNLAFEKQPFEETPTYIRKDALMSWLNDMKFMANSERAGAYQNVIDKLNSL